MVEIDGLTGLAEYRNGGLFVDTGVLRLTDPEAARRTHLVSDPLIIAWRAMTIALLDRLAPKVRALLGVSEEAFPLARMLEGYLSPNIYGFIIGGGSTGATTAAICRQTGSAALLPTSLL